jgi:hypothetical protein
MTDAQDAADAVAAAAGQPKIVTVAGVGSSEEHLIPDKIAAAKFEANRRAVAGADGFGLRFVKLNPPGAR